MPRNAARDARRAAVRLEQRRAAVSGFGAYLRAARCTGLACHVFFEAARVRQHIICMSEFQLQAPLPGDLCFRRLRQMFSWRLVLANREAVAHRRAQIEAEHARASPTQLRFEKGFARLSYQLAGRRIAPRGDGVPSKLLKRLRTKKVNNELVAALDIGVPHAVPDGRGWHRLEAAVVDFLRRPFGRSATRDRIIKHSLRLLRASRQVKTADALLAWCAAGNGAPFALWHKIFAWSHNEADVSSRFTLEAAVTDVFVAHRRHLHSLGVGHKPFSRQLRRLGLDVERHWMNKQLGKRLTSAPPGLERPEDICTQKEDSLIRMNSRLQAVEEFMTQRIFHLENRECSAIRKQLIHLEDHDASGRVTLADFYNTTLHNFFSSAFTESENYLRDTGALDETVPGMPRVIIPNYLMLDSNCLGSSEYYAVCCIDECEVLLDKIETQIRAPTASPAQLSQLVSSLGAEFSLDEGSWTELQARLGDIADNEGQVPLHGRMFAQ
ncbi:unnamed protein product, partial [Symbiodinium pilosum]